MAQIENPTGLSIVRSIEGEEFKEKVEEAIASIDPSAQQFRVPYNPLGLLLVARQEIRRAIRCSPYEVVNAEELRTELQDLIASSSLGESLEVERGRVFGYGQVPGRGANKLMAIKLHYPEPTAERQELTGELDEILGLEGEFKWMSFWPRIKIAEGRIPNDQTTYDKLECIKKKLPRKFILSPAIILPNQPAQTGEARP